VLLLALAAPVALAGASSAGVPQATKGQQACANGVNAGWLGVVKAQNADTTACLKSVASGKATLEDCLGRDLKGKVAKAEAKTSGTDAKECGAPDTPAFGYTGAATANAAAKEASTASFDAIFGAEPNVVSKAVDKAGAACQAEVAKRAFKLSETWAAEANKAKKSALKGATPPVGDAAGLGAALDAALAASAKVTKAENGVNTGVAKKCPDAVVADLFDCGDATTSNGLALCVIAAAKEEACLSFETADAVPLDCLGDELLVGAASRSILPLVAGSYDYLTPGFPPRSDPFDVGIPVPAWDDGRIAVGNGASDSYWVHDDVRATALAIQRPGKDEIVVLVATDLYMVFRLDAEGIRAKVAALVGAELAPDLRVIVTATHNHHGPDTAFDVNHDWYEHMTDQVAAAVAEAVEERQPATLRVAAGQHWFGAEDGTDPQVFDPSLNVLQARDSKGAAIATLVQWNNHPEATLGWEPPLSAIEADCVVLGLEGEDCEAEGRYFTSDFPGVLRDVLAESQAGEVLYLNGALGVIIGPGGTQVWEVDESHPLGNQMVAPAGAVAPGGGTNYEEENFRKTAIIGEQLAAAVLRLLDGAQTLGRTKLDYAVQPFYTRLSNIGFRVLLVVDEMTGRADLGHDPATLYTCPALGPKTDATCVSDGGDTIFDAAIEVSYRVGDHLKTAVEYLRIGGVGIMFLTGEIPSELTIGLPADFRTMPEQWYEEAPDRHAFGADYTIPGFVRQRMADEYEWTVGLGSDQLGYHVPISNFRALCVGDEIVGEGTCDALYEEGSIEFPDSVAGTTCKDLIENPDPNDPAFVVASCKYGQALGEADGHYEETNSAGWDLVEDMMNAVAAITGNDDATEVNPEFPGWWPGLLPPGDLP
jgi:hypothetical protein